MRPPEDFDDWLMTWKTRPNAEDVKTTWRKESIYTAVYPIECASQRLTDAVMDVSCRMRQHGRLRESKWSSAENHAAMFSDVQDQAQFVEKLLTEELQPFLEDVGRHMEELEDEISLVDATLVSRFKVAELDDRYDMIAPMWKEATDLTSTTVWEASWHIARLKSIRTLMRMHLTASVGDLLQDLKTSVNRLKRAME